LGGILLGTIGLHYVVLFDATSFFFVCLMLFCMRLPVRAKTDIAREDHEQRMPITNVFSAWLRVGHEWLEGMRLVARQRTLFALFTFLAVTGIGEGIFGSLLVIFVSRVLHGNSVVYGMLLSIQMVGNLLGNVLVAQLGKRQSPLRALWISACIFGVIDLLIIDVPVFYPVLPLVMFLFVIVGIPAAFFSVHIQTLFQVLTEDKLRGRVFGTRQAVSSLASLIGMLLAGLFGDRLGSVPLLNLQGGSYVFGALLIFLSLRGGIAFERKEANPVKDIA